MKTTILTNNIQNILRHSEEFVRYECIILDVFELPLTIRDKIHNEIDLAFYNFGDTIHYTKTDFTYRLPQNHSKITTSPIMMIKARLNHDLDTLYMTYKTKTTTYNKAFYVDDQLELTKRGCEDDVDIISPTFVDMYTTLANKYADIVLFEQSQEYNCEFYDSRVTQL